MIKFVKHPPLKSIYYSLSIALLVAGAAAKVKNDIQTHKAHPVHRGECKCNDKCFSCLVS